MRKVFVTSIAVFLAITSLQAQIYKEVGLDLVEKELGALSRAYNAENMELPYVKMLYRNKGELQAATIVKGVIYRGIGQEYRLEEPGTFLVQNDKLKMQVDSANQVVVVSKIDSMFSTVSLDQVLAKVKAGSYAIKRGEDKNLVFYQITPKNVAEGITVICFSPQDSWIRSVEITLPKANYYMEDMADETLETPAVMMIYEKPKKIQQKNLFNLNQWLILNQDKVALQAAYATFKLHDSRLPQTKNN